MFLIFDGLPPSTNKLYTVARGRKILTTEGRRYKRKIAQEIAQCYPTHEGFTRDDAISLSIHLVLDIVTKSKNAKNRYKKWDVSNRIKVREDAVCESLGIDDSQILRLTVEKCQRYKDAKEQTIVTIAKLTNGTQQPSSDSSAESADSE